MAEATALSESRVDAILDMMEDLGFDQITEPEALEEALKQGLGSPAFRQVLVAFVNGIYAVSGIGSPMSTHLAETEDTSELCIELGSFIQEYGCVHRELVENTIGALEQLPLRVTLLEYLLSELQACCMMRSKLGASAFQQSDSMDTTSDTLMNTPEARLQQIVTALELPITSPTTVEAIFSAITAKVSAILEKIGEDYLTSPILDKPLTDAQWAKLKDLNDKLAEEYAVRRQMLLKRADVTVQSFKWSERIKPQLAHIDAVSQPLRAAMSTASTVDIHDILFACQDLLDITKTSAERNSTVSRVQQHIMVKKVSDRGGRPGEKRPPASMPAFRKRTVGKSQPQRERRGRGGGRGGGRGRGRGGREGRGGKQ
eukprot:m.7548 g.7548  ORF g.7548 m.7548 type:complete len:372 (+) comp5261_c0_seq2:87-1202(+)